MSVMLPLSRRSFLATPALLHPGLRTSSPDPPDPAPPESDTVDNASPTDLETRVAVLEAVVADGGVHVGPPGPVGPESPVEPQAEQGQLTLAASAMGEGPGEVWLHTFPGIDDNERLRAAITYITQQTKRPALRFWTAGGVSDEITTTIDEFAGMRLKGPVDNVGMQNFEQNQNSVPYVLRLRVGTGSSAFIRGTGTVFGMNVSDLCVVGVGTNCQFWDHPWGTTNSSAFSVSMGNMQFMHMRHVLGRTGEALAMTLWSFWGSWNVLSPFDEPFLLRGSDNFLTPAKLNIGWNNAPANKYLLRMSLTKSKVANWYFTCRGGASRAILVEGYPGVQGDLRIRDCVIEGQNAGDPASSALVRCQNNAVASFRDCALNYAMANPAANQPPDQAYFEVTGRSRVWIDGFDVNRANVVGESVPVARVSNGATLDVRRMRGIRAWTQRPLVVNAGGTLTHDASVRDV
jgi:hypothetical protein